MPHIRSAVVLVALTLASLLLAFTGSPASTAPTAEATRAGEHDIAARPVTPPPGAPPATPVDIRNVIVIMADDLDVHTFNAVPRLAALRTQALAFTNHTVTDSLCCPSRVSFLRGQYVHNHQVVSNMAATGGGWATFRDRGGEADCLPVWLSHAGVRTALIGKYLNEYPGRTDGRIVPPGWDRWVVPTTPGAAYRGKHYTLNIDGSLRSFGGRDEHYLNDVLTRHAVRFITKTTEPFYLQFSSFLPHDPAPVARRHRGTHQRTPMPDLPTTVPANAPSWLRSVPVGDRNRPARLEKRWRKHLRSTEALADSIDAIRAALTRAGHADDTAIIITSDNGYHYGAHGLAAGKRTAFDTDTVVPMLVIAPGTPVGHTDALTSAIDLAPTIADLLAAPVPDWVDGRSLTAFLRTGHAPSPWRSAILTEALSASGPADPDYTAYAPDPFASIRTRDWILVRYTTGETELYDRRRDPNQTRNIAAEAPRRVIDPLLRTLDALAQCAGPTCRTADTPPRSDRPGRPA